MCNRLPRRVRLVTAMLLLIGLVQVACSPAAQLSTVLNQQVEEVLGQLFDDVVIVRVINQTNNDIELDLLVDNVGQTVDCSAALQVCDLVLSNCPQDIRAVEQRSLDPQGRFVGGRFFNDTDAFNFGPGEFDCQSVIVYKFTEGGAEAFKI
jgi:hypothetical protein